VSQQTFGSSQILGRFQARIALLNDLSNGQQRPSRARGIQTRFMKRIWEDVPFIPMGEYWQVTAYRKDLTNVLPGCFAVFYGVRRV
jgi:peptide/nickel transport system substrate-binding protein